VVCLQKLEAPREKFPQASTRDAGYGAIRHGQKSWNGAAIGRVEPSPKKPASAFR
jgi:exodeoxyribonuclease-3